MGSFQSRSRDREELAAQQARQQEAESAKRAAQWARQQEAELAEWRTLWGDHESHSEALDEDRAWTIATAWCEQLQAEHDYHKRLQLKTDAFHTHELALVQSYEWIKIEVKSDAEAAIVRAAATAWFWLSCCPGYSGVENPVFWKRVFSLLQQYKHILPIADRRPLPRDPPITDIVRFFDQPGREFPRIRIQARPTDAADVFLGTRAAPVDPVRDQKLSAIYGYLKPFMTARLLQRPIPVGIECKEWQAASELAASDLVAMPPHEQLKTPEAPRFVVCSKRFHARHRYQGNNESHLLSERHLDVKSVSWWEREKPSRPSELQRLFGIGSPSDDVSPIKTLLLKRASLSQALVASVFSALPHAKRFSTVRMPTPKPYSSIGRRYVSSFRAFEALDWAWIGYAIFHPDAQTSTWEVLDIGVDDLTLEAASVLRLMATGNNLCCVENQRAVPTSRFYHTARLLRTTTVRSGPALRSKALMDVDDSSVVCLAVEGDEVDPTRLEKWTRVVVPGLGFGWILSATIAAVESRAPGKPCLRGLRFNVGDNERQPEGAAELINVIGENLTWLYADACGVVDAKKLTQLFAACPAVRTLSIALSLPTPLSVFSALPHLRELRLRVNGDDLPLILPTTPDSPWRELTALQIIPSTTYRLPEGLRDAIRTLLETHHKLEYLTWGKQHSYRRDDYVTRRTLSLAVLGDSPGVTHFHKPLSERACLALLSVIDERRAADPADALTRVGEDIFKLIVAFAATSCLRDVWID